MNYLNYSSPYPNPRGPGWIIVLLDRGLAFGDPHWFATEAEAWTWLNNPVDTETAPESQDD